MITTAVVEQKTILNKTIESIGTFVRYYALDVLARRVLLGVSGVLGHLVAPITDAGIRFTFGESIILRAKPGWVD
jgi:hypothetical protein